MEHIWRGRLSFYRKGPPLSYPRCTVVFHTLPAPLESIARPSAHLIGPKRRQTPIHRTRLLSHSIRARLPPRHSHAADRPAHGPPSLVAETSRTTSPATTSAASRTSEATPPSQAPCRATIPLLALSRRRTTRVTTPTLSTPHLRARETRCAPSTARARRRRHCSSPSAHVISVASSHAPTVFAGHSSTTLTTHDLPHTRHPSLPFPIV
ncbi:hypothetical protein C8J57DRAFT_1519101 [Mycena rebaudengoi]|nr:hypothetical protein C8J57DRAFT_1519101 [Mycena rebaudengoi]